MFAPSFGEADWFVLTLLMPVSSSGWNISKELTNMSCAGVDNVGGKLTVLLQ